MRTHRKNPFKIEVSAPTLEQLHDAIVDVASGAGNRDSISEIRVDDVACCAEIVWGYCHTATIHKLY